MAEYVGYVSLTPDLPQSMLHDVPATTATSSTRRVVIVAFPGIQSLDVVGPFEVFASATQVARHELATPVGHTAVGHTAVGYTAVGYEVSVVSSGGGMVTSESGLGLSSAPLPPLDGGPLQIDTLILAGGAGVFEARHDVELVTWIAAVAPHCRRVATVCTGTFLAAQAGLLVGRRVTTHWARAARLAAEFPSVIVDPDPIYVRDGNVWTSAADGVHCYSPQGKLLGKILVPEVVSNLTFGGPQRNRLFITATTSLYAVYVAKTGDQRP